MAFGLFVYSFILLLLTVLLWTSNIISRAHMQEFLRGIFLGWIAWNIRKADDQQYRRRPDCSPNVLTIYTPTSKTEDTVDSHLCYYFAMGRNSSFWKGCYFMLFRILFVYFVLILYYFITEQLSNFPQRFFDNCFFLYVV